MSVSELCLFDVPFLTVIRMREDWNPHPILRQVPSVSIYILCYVHAECWLQKSVEISQMLCSVSGVTQLIERSWRISLGEIFVIRYLCSSDTAIAIYKSSSSLQTAS